MTTETEAIAKFLTVAGVALTDRSITVDLVDDGGKAVCRGCGEDWANPSYPSTVAQWARSHAETCRAMPLDGAK